MEIRTFFTKTFLNEFTCTLEDEEFIHAVKVDRLKVGDKARVIDNTEFEYFCEVIEIQKNKVILKINQKQICEKNPKIDLDVFLCLLKGDKIDNILPKLSELGVKNLYLVSSQNVDRKGNINFDRLNKISVTSAKQCERSKVLNVENKVLNFDNVLDSIQNYDNFLVFYENEPKVNLNNIKLKKGKSAIFIGSEGGFLESEINALKNKNASSVSLGNLILKADTAVVVATTLTTFLLGGLNK